MGKFIIDTLNNEDVRTAMSMLYGLCSDQYCYRKEFDSLKQENNLLQQDKDNLRKEIDDLKKKLVDIQDEKEKTQNVNSELTEENNRLKEEKLKISQESKKYRDRLSEMGMNNNDAFDKTYYQVLENSLERTMNNKAPYIVTKNEFFFNEDGQYQKAIQEKEKILCPFCDIVEEISEANYVMTINKGRCKVLENDVLSIIEKAKIKLIRR